MNPAIEILNLSLGYEGNMVLEDVNLTIPRGTLCGFLGPNGAGKSTLVKGILALMKPMSGHITVSKEDTMAYVPQSDAVDWDFPATVLDVVMMGSYGRLGWFKRPGKGEKAQAQAVLRKLNMEEYQKRQINQLSGGQKQRVFLARALMQEASIFVLDEPFKGVDVQTEKTIVTLLKELQSQGKTLVVVHHDLHTVEEYFDWLVFVQGSIVATGATQEVFTPDNLRRTFGKGNILEMRA